MWSLVANCKRFCATQYLQYVDSAFPLPSTRFPFFETSEKRCLLDTFKNIQPTQAFQGFDAAQHHQKKKKVVTEREWNELLWQIESQKGELAEAMARIEILERQLLNKP